MTAALALRRGLGLAALAALACAAPGPQVAPIPLGHGRVVLSPLNVALRTPAELQGSGAPVWAELVRYLRQQDRPLAVVDPADAERLWGSARGELERAGAVVDPSSTASRFAELLAAHVDYEVLVMPSLVVRQARIGGYRASWDGVQRDLPVRGALPIAFPVVGGLSGVTVSGYRGRIAAASLYVAILASDGEPLYEGLAGLDLIQELTQLARPHDAPKWSLAPRRDAFADGDALREGIERAFARRLSKTASSLRDQAGSRSE